MPIQVQGPDGQMLEFPDDTPRETMKAAMAKRYGGPQNPTAPQTQGQQPDPSEGGSTLQFATPFGTLDSGVTLSQGITRGLAGIGKSFADTRQGIGQLFGSVSQADVDERRKMDAPLMATGAGMMGNIAGQVAQMAIPVGGGVRAASLVGRAAPFANAAARAGGLASLQPMATGQNRVAETAKAAAAGVVGQGLAAGAGKLASGAVSRMDDASAALARKAEGFGLKLGLPNLSDNALVRTAASQMERLPFSGATKRANANQAAFNREVANTFGAKSDKITPDVFAAAKNKLQNGFETLSARNSLRLDTGHVAQIKTVLDEATRLGGSDTARMVRGWAHELLGKVDKDGVIPGKAYQSFDSRLGKVLKSGGEPAHYLGQLRDTVRAAMDSSISASDRAAWKTVRKQYAALKTVEPLVAKSEAGNISPQALMGRVTADGAGKTRMATGRAGALGDLARIGQRFLKASPNSGTADRLLVNAAVGGGLFGAQQQGLISPETAMYVGGGLLLNRVAGSALNSRALAMGEGRTLNGLARLMQPAPKYLPASLSALMGQPQPLEIDIVGGRAVSPEQMEAELQRLGR